jgi:adenylate kinase
MKAKDLVTKIHIYFLVILHAADSMLIERAAGKRIDPKTGDIYHTTFDWPTENNIHQRLVVSPHNTEEDLVNRLMEYNRNIGAIQDSLKATVKVVNVDQPKGDVFNQSNQRFMLIKK